jgi:predicted RNA methylase
MIADLDQIKGIDSKKNQAKLALISEKLIHHNLYPIELQKVLYELKMLYSAVSGLDKGSASYTLDIHHSTGKAVGTKWAELCIDDMMRTQKFIKGAYLAVKEKLAVVDKKTVTLLYVGTGPFATLVMPLTTIFSPEELQLILVEVNPLSAQSLRETINNFGVSNYVKEIITEDAAELKINNPEFIDILLLECLQYALVKEQQVAITYNILPQLKNDVFLLPKEIKLNLCLINNKKQHDYLMGLEGIEPDYYRTKNNLFLVNKENVLQNKHTGLAFPEVTTILTEEDKAMFDKIVISTEICVFDDERLEINQTSLTIMYHIDEMDHVRNYNKITTQYTVSEVPGFAVKWI